MMTQHEIEQPIHPKTELPAKLGQIGIFKRQNYFLEENVNFHGGSQKRTGIELTLWSWMSAFIDALVLISISCFAIVLFSLMMKSVNPNFFKIVTADMSLAKMFFMTFLFSFWGYLVLMRAFMGATLGEWSCQLRLGQPAQRIKSTYILRVIARTSLILLTGLIVSPVLSLVFKKDLIGDLTGVKVYSLL